MAAFRMAAISSPLFSSVISASCTWEALALATASSTVSQSHRPVPAFCGAAGQVFSRGGSSAGRGRLRSTSSTIC